MDTVNIVVSFAAFIGLVVYTFTKKPAKGHVLPPPTNAPTQPDRGGEATPEDDKIVIE